MFLSFDKNIVNNFHLIDMIFKTGWMEILHNQIKFIKLNKKTKQSDTFWEQIFLSQMIIYYINLPRYFLILHHPGKTALL